MKFIVDEQLPPSLVTLLNEKGFNTIHALSLGTNFLVSDSEICLKSMSEKRIVISKDVDFFIRQLSN